MLIIMTFNQYTHIHTYTHTHTFTHMHTITNSNKQGPSYMFTFSPDSMATVDAQLENQRSPNLFSIIFFQILFSVFSSVYLIYSTDPSGVPWDA